MKTKVWLLAIAMLITGEAGALPTPWAVRLQAPARPACPCNSLVSLGQPC